MVNWRLESCQLSCPWALNESSSQLLQLAPYLVLWDGDLRSFRISRDDCQFLVCCRPASHVASKTTCKSNLLSTFPKDNDCIIAEDVQLVQARALSSTFRPPSCIGPSSSARGINRVLSIPGRRGWEDSSALQAKISWRTTVLPRAWLLVGSMDS